MAKLITIFGGSGFVGRYVVQALAKTGARLRVATRDPHLALHVRPLAALGQLDFVRTDLGNAASLARAVEGADAVVNLVGTLSDSHGGFEAVHVKGAGAIAKAAAAAGAAVLVHVSALGADAESESGYGRSKALGEAAVRAAFPKATILRPSVIFGSEDGFLNRFAGLLRLPVVPVVAPATKFQPVYVVDVARAIAAAACEPSLHAGKTVSLGGPDVLTMRGLLDWLAQTTGRDPVLVDVPDAAAGLLASLTGWLPGAPLTTDQWKMLQTDNVVPEGAPGLSALGVDATPMAAVAPGWLVRFRPHGRFSVA
ncbi:complex I NDUFA9 subunit family protein [Sphingosinicella microcystinivorans]|uniref:complex I NDUFA9 subunit family protein n=1 Tax=Sphingosinicella microcystinivorans TaxID=335406 RepID=UPI0022F38F77|nr:complex I NDUFA9 subunit family protein [Sphingosinicella microcystinivorans]WBX86231.1 complex I NDUFA9 subunit family protein [Sphingosinicella microcystinivorans]